MKKIAVISTLAALALCAGCGITMKEAGRGLMGTSTKILEYGRPQAISKEFPCQAAECRQKVLGLLKDMSAYIYRQEGDLIAMYVTASDTTPVGVFVTKEGGKTMVEVSSPSSYAKEHISRGLFAGLDKQFKQKKVNVQLDAVEGKKLP